MFQWMKELQHYMEESKFKDETISILSARIKELTDQINSRENEKRVHFADQETAAQIR